MPRRFLHEAILRSELELRPRPVPGGLDARVLVILGWTALGLTLVHYLGDAGFASGLLGDCGLREASRGLRAWAESSALHRLGWWVGAIVVAYALVPLLLIRLVLRESPLDYGWRIRGALEDWRLGGLLLAAVVPIVAWASSSRGFLARYPFYDPGRGGRLWPDLWIWELLYLLHFVAVEFFFRGFITLGLRRRFGFDAVLVMTVPYAMVHFGKPMPEALGAILAGLALGTLAMRSGSIWMGVLLHWGVALTMDLSALWRRGLLP